MFRALVSRLTTTPTAAMLGFAVFSAFAIANPAMPAERITVGAMAPVFDAALLDSAAKQPGFSFERMRGRVVYVDFWASWCVPCRISFPALDALYRKFRNEGFEVIAVNKDVEKGAVPRFLARHPVAFKLLDDPGDSIVSAYRVKTMPSGFLVDRKGVVRYVHEGFRADSAASIEAQIVKLLREPS